ncbi:MAG: hypothetical protein H0T78_01845 [Longispora sp.]|nr:hypothetical protein [Longispora sp. (in: high G+C Gram-positive bacteria)]
MISSLWRTIFMGITAAACLLAGIGLSNSASATTPSPTTGTAQQGHGTKYDYYLVNLQSVTMGRPHTRGHSGWTLAQDPEVPRGGKFFVYDADTSEVPAVIDPSREDKQALFEVSDWNDVAFDYNGAHIEVRYGDYMNARDSLLVASASRYGWLADMTNEHFTGYGTTLEEAETAAKHSMRQFEVNNKKSCRSGGSSSSQDSEMFPGSWTFTYSATCS